MCHSGTLNKLRVLDGVLGYMRYVRGYVCKHYPYRMHVIPTTLYTRRLSLGRCSGLKITCNSSRYAATLAAFIREALT